MTYPQRGRGAQLLRHNFKLIAVIAQGTKMFLGLTALNTKMCLGLTAFITKKVT